MAKSLTGIAVLGLDKHGPVSPHLLLTTLNSLVGASSETVPDGYIVTLAVQLALKDKDKNASHSI